MVLYLNHQIELKGESKYQKVTDVTQLTVLGYRHPVSIPFSFSWTSGCQFNKATKKSQQKWKSKSTALFISPEITINF
jgi:hypothetical protein